MASLAVKYRPKTWADVTEQSVVVEMLKNICEKDELQCRNFLLTGPAGCAKAQPLDSRILTPNGFITMRDIRAGDEVVTASNNIGHVASIHPQGRRNIYEMRCQDGAIIRVADNHLNVVDLFNYRIGQSVENCVISTDRLLSYFNSHRYRISVKATYADFNERPVPLDPYLVGVIAACGYATDSIHLNLKYASESTMKRISNIVARYNATLRPVSGENDGHYFIRCNNSTYKYAWNDEPASINSIVENVKMMTGRTISSSTVCKVASGGHAAICDEFPQALSLIGKADDNIFCKLSQLGMRQTRHDMKIDESYIYNSSDVRTQVIEGMVACCGEETTSGTRMKLMSSTLAAQVVDIIRSLGFVSTLKTVSRYDVRLKHNITSYWVNVRLHDTKENSLKTRPIVSIKSVGYHDCQCIYIDHDDHTYISDGFIPTHNTTLARIMANALNKDTCEPIEIDAASNNGVDSVREIVKQASQYPIGSKYKVFIHDECFHKDTPVSTPEGYRRISDIRPGDYVYNIAGSAKVSKVFRNSVDPTNLTIVRINGSDILTTKDHLFFTDSGWVPAKDLQVGESVYDSQTMRSVREGFSDISERQSQNMQYSVRTDSADSEYEEISFNLSEDGLYQSMSNMWNSLLHTSLGELNLLFKNLFNKLQEATRAFAETDRCICFAQAGIYLSCLRQAYEHPEERQSEVLFDRMFGDRKSTGETRYPTTKEVLCDMWEYIHPEIRHNNDVFKDVQVCVDSVQESRTKGPSIFSKNEDKQSDVKSGYCCENEINSDSEWNILESLCTAWREWASNRTSIKSTSSIREWMGLRISCEDSYYKGQSDALSIGIQTRPCLAGKEAGCRGGWDKPQYEISAIIRCKERNLPSRFRVEGVEIFKPGYNDRYFESYFDHSELYSEFVEMYDLEVCGHPSYFVNDTLVHNCHAYSQASWSILLKTIEEQPAKTVMIFCTTNPEKIPSTIISRVQVFQLSKISTLGIQNRLKYILDCENNEGRDIKYDINSLGLIAKMANGGMRDAITLMEKSLSYSTTIDDMTLTSALGLPPYDDYFEFLKGYAKHDNAAISASINKAYNSGINFIRWIQDLHAFVMNVVKYIYMQDMSYTTIPSFYQPKLANYNTAHVIVCLRLANKLINLLNELKTTSYQQEVALTYLCAVPKKV